MEKEEVDFISSEVIATVSLYLDKEDNGVELGIKLEVSIEGGDHSVAQEYVNKAQHYCPYTKALNENVDVEIIIK